MSYLATKSLPLDVQNERDQPLGPVLVDGDAIDRAKRGREARR